MELLRRSVDIDLRTTIDPRVVKAVDWLLTQQNADGSFGAKNPAYTAWVSIAIMEWRSEFARSEEFGRALDFLKGYGPSGRLETLWDTAAAVQLFLKAGRSDPWAQQALDYLRNVDLSKPPVRPHHAAQMVAALWAADPSDPRIGVLRDHIEMSLDDQDGSYEVGQAVWACQRGPAMHQGPARRWRDYLNGWVTTASVNNSSFVQYCSGLLGLSQYQTDNIRTQIANRVDNLFQEGYRQDGSWYHDVWATAWALLTLGGAGYVRRVAVSLPAINLALDSLERRLHEAEVSHEAHRRRLSNRVFGEVVADSAGFTLLAAGAGLSVWHFDLGISVGVLALLAPIEVWLFRRLVRLRRLVGGRPQLGNGDRVGSEGDV